MKNKLMLLGDAIAATFTNAASAQQIETAFSRTKLADFYSSTIKMTAQLPTKTLSALKERK